MKFERWYTISEIRDMSETEEVDRLRAKKKQIHEDLEDPVEREWVGLTDEERSQIHNDFIHKKIGIWEVCDFCEAKLKEKNT